jgi:hypothetical protein
MANPIGKIAIKTVQQTEVQKTETIKNGPSKFDQRKAEIDAKHAAGPPPEVTNVSADQKRVLESNLRKHMEKPERAAEVFKIDLRKTRVQMDGVARQVEAAPKSPAMDAVRQRLTSIEAQFHDASRKIYSLNGSTSPNDMLQLQIQMYKMVQNVELMSKFVEQTTGGVKSILQTQV